MTPGQAEDLIYAAFVTGWAGQTPVAYDNKNFDAEVQETNYVTISIQHNVGTIASLGGLGTRNFRQFGIIILQVFTLAGGGKRPNMDLCVTARNIFRGIHLAGNLWFRNVSIQHAGPDGKWYQQNVTAEFSFDESE